MSRPTNTHTDTDLTPQAFHAALCDDGMQPDIEWMDADWEWLSPEQLDRPDAFDRIAHALADHVPEKYANQLADYLARNGLIVYGSGSESDWDGSPMPGHVDIEAHHPDHDPHLGTEAER